MIVFRSKRFALHTIFTALLLSLPIRQGFADKGHSKKREDIPYVTTRAARLENKGKKGILRFSSVAQALHGIDYFKKHHNDGKKNRSKKAIHSLFYRLGTRKSISTKTAKHFADFFEKEAKKSGVRIRNNARACTQFLLEKCDMPVFTHSIKITFRRLRKKKTFTLTNNKARVISLPVFAEHVIKTDRRDPFKDRRDPFEAISLKKVMQSKIDEDFHHRSYLYYLLREFNIAPFRKIKKKILENDSPFYRHSSSCEIDFLVRFKDEKSVPPILPIHLRRRGIDDNRRILPSRILEFPLKNDPSKKAQFALVSMVGEKFVRKDSLPYSCVLTKEKNGVSWVHYDHTKVEVTRGNIARQGTLLFYQFIGFTKTQQLDSVQSCSSESETQTVSETETDSTVQSWSSTEINGEPV